jgi:hypothetical protein
MALFQFGSIVTGARNSVAGMTYSQNKGGTYIKAKPIPTNPRSSRQTAVRAMFAANAKLWSGVLTDAQRGAWTAFAASNPYTNVFGQAKQLSGMAMMMSLNQVLANLGVSPIDNAPSDLSVPALAAITGATITSVADTVDTVEINTAAQVVVAGAKYYVFATPVLAGGKTAGVSDYRFLGAFPAVAAAVVVDMTSLYVSLFGSNAPAGTHISLLVATVNVASGALTPSVVYDSGAL